MTFSPRKYIEDFKCESFCLYGFSTMQRYKLLFSKKKNTHTVSADVTYMHAPRLLIRSLKLHSMHRVIHIILTHARIVKLVSYQGWTKMYGRKISSNCVNVFECANVVGIYVNLLIFSYCKKRGMIFMCYPSRECE